MTKKEKQIDNQEFVYADWKDTNGLIDNFEKAIENFGLFMYDNPECSDSDTYGFIISNKRLTKKQVIKLCEIECGHHD
ncbi:MAG: hypothetical protein U9R15_04735 [Chloroflexota bacterium]|nr:hypothetical protein [Chloroflexota bacterium]